SAVDALFLSTRGSGALVSPSAVAGKVMLVGVTVVGTTAVPLSLIVCGLFGALCVITIVPERAPVAKGVNVTEIAHDAPPASAAPQLLVWAKSPESTILAMESAVDALFLSTRGSGALVSP